MTEINEGGTIEFPRLRFPPASRARSTEACDWAAPGARPDVLKVLKLEEDR